MKRVISVGILGAAGTIGRFHLHQLLSGIEGATVCAVYDINAQACAQLAQTHGLRQANSAQELIAMPEVDAVFITSWDATHASLTQQCIAAGKPVFCEKPLATTLADCAAVWEAEKQAGRRLVQVGFMRRFDPDYRRMKEILWSGELGAPLMAHCISRTPRIAESHTTPMHITNIAIHEIDVFRWLLQEELVEGQVLFPRTTALAAPPLRDPQLVLLQSESGVLIDLEASANSYYGYEIGCELVCEKGTIRLPLPAAPVVRSRLAVKTDMFDDWARRFPDAYREEVQHFVDWVRGDIACDAPGCTDGYAACAVADMLMRAQESGMRERVL